MNMFGIWLLPDEVTEKAYKPQTIRFVKTKSGYVMRVHVMPHRAVTIGKISKRKSGLWRAIYEPNHSLDRGYKDLGRWNKLSLAKDVLKRAWRARFEALKKKHRA